MGKLAHSFCRILIYPLLHFPSKTPSEKYNAFKTTPALLLSGTPLTRVISQVAELYGARACLDHKMGKQKEYDSLVL